MLLHTSLILMFHNYCFKKVKKDNTHSSWISKGFCSTFHLFLVIQASAYLLHSKFQLQLEWKLVMDEYYPNLNPVSDVLHTIKKTFVKLAPELNRRTKKYTNRSSVADILATLEDTDGKYNQLYYTNFPRIY